MKRILFTAILLSTIFAYGEDKIIELPEFVYESKQLKALHILAYVREYSSISTYTDTIFLFREKMVDYMLAPDKGTSFKGWNNPRVLTSESYYHFTNDHGLDSVSNHYNQHFSWSDWIGIAPKIPFPPKITRGQNVSDTIMGKYSACEIWHKTDEQVTTYVNVLAAPMARRWVPGLSHFFNDEVEFDEIKLNYVYNNIGDTSLLPIDCIYYFYNVESRGRGRNIYLFNRADEPFFVSTSADVFIIDKEYITLKEAKKWEKISFENNDFDIYVPPSIPDIPEKHRALIDRVNSINHDEARLSLSPDKKLAGRNLAKLNPGQMILKRLKGMTGIDNMVGKKKREQQWGKFRENQKQKNKSKN